MKGKIMANCCFFEFEISFLKKSDKEAVFHYLETRRNISKKKNEGLFVGSSTRYFFDSEIYDNSDTSLIISGYVKWSISDNEMLDIYRYINNICTINKFTLLYQEMSCLVYGEFSYNRNNVKDIITNKYLTEYYIANKIQENDELEFGDIYSLKCDLIDNGEVNLIKIKS